MNDRLLMAVKCIVPATVVAVGVLALLGFGSAAGQSSTAPSAPVPFSVGDVFAGIGNGRWNHFSPTGTLLATLDDGVVGTVGGFSPAHATTGMCFDPAGNMYGTNFAANSMSRFSNDGTLISASVGTFDAQPESCLVANGDTIFTSQVLGTGDILKLDLAGTQLAHYDVRRSDWIDLAADQCTMLYSDEGAAIHRFNVCTNAAMTDFVTGGYSFFALRILPDGTVLAASRSSVKHFDSSGAEIGTYTVSGESLLFALNLDPDGAHFWTGGLSGSNIYEFNITPVGPPVLSFSPQVAAGGGTGLAGLAVFGEILVSQASTPPPVVPSVATVDSTVLGLGIIVLLVVVVLMLFLLARRKRRAR